MGKRLTEKEIEGRQIAKIIQRIRALEKVYPQNLIERACFRYKDANLQKRNAKMEIEAMEKKLQQAKSILKEK